MSEMRPVPRNIDSASRVPEYVVAFFGSYYAVQFMFLKAVPAFAAGFVSVYIIYKITQDKPEGMMYRAIYRLFGMGKLINNPKKAPKFEI